MDSSTQRSAADVTDAIWRLVEPLLPVEHLWPLTNNAVINQYVATIEDLEDAQCARCAALQLRPDLIRSTTRFRWWPKRIAKRRGPRRN
jgi:hypothetical protein